MFKSILLLVVTLCGIVLAGETKVEEDDKNPLVEEIVEFGNLIERLSEVFKKGTKIFGIYFFQLNLLAYSLHEN